MRHFRQWPLKKFPAQPCETLLEEHNILSKNTLQCKQRRKCFCNPAKNRLFDIKMSVQFNTKNHFITYLCVLLSMQIFSVLCAYVYEISAAVITPAPQHNGGEWYLIC